MSTYFEIACRDCECDMHEQRDIRDEDDLQNVLDNLEAFVTFYEAVKNRMEATVRVGGGYIDFDWLERHKGHRLAVRCEYENWEQLEQRLATGLSWWDY
ncbi:MAG: hypothetical protein ACE5F6_00050 [Anaerolineae bacterium]